MGKENNHFVPQFYLKFFSNNEKSIGMYHSERKLYVSNASIKRQAFSKFLYGKDGVLEDHLMEMEGHAARVLKGIIESLRIPDRDTEDYHILLLFMLLSEARALKTADSYNNFIDIQSKTMLKMDRNSKVNLEELENVKIGLDIPNATAMSVAAEIYPILLDLKAVLLVSDCDRSFITSDNPMARYNFFYVQRNYQIRGYGLGNMGIQLFLPLNSKVCLMIYDHIAYECKETELNIHRINKGLEVDEINRLTYYNSMNSIYFNNRISESYIKRIFQDLKAVNDIEKEVNAFGSMENKIIMYQQSFVKHRIKMPFINMNPQFNKMDLPLHMAGPIRPHAHKFTEDLKMKSKAK